DSIEVRLSSRLSVSNATFYLDEVTLSDVAAACFGAEIDIYVFSGNAGSYAQEAVATGVLIPSSASFTISYTDFTPTDIESEPLTRFLFEISG
ncbi:hypothetical protein N9H87_02985, partial [Pontimonas sp.]